MTRNKKLPKWIKRKNNIAFLGAAILTISASCLTILFFFDIFNLSYKKTVTTENIYHLEEITKQISLYIDTKINNDWVAAHSIARSLSFLSTIQEENLIAFIHNEISFLEVDDIVFYTEDGYAISATDRIISNEQASEISINANRKKEFLSIIQSTFTYSVPVINGPIYNGSKVIAISIIHNLDSFLDDMGFKSFNESALMYLVQENGIVVSYKTSKNTPVVFNIKSLLKGRTFIYNDIKSSEVIDTEETINKLLTTESILSILESKNDTFNYIISAPIDTNRTPMKLFYIIPQNAINKSMNTFSTDIQLFSILLIIVIFIFLVIYFTVLYNSKKQKFDIIIQSRERLFNLLVKQTRYAFALFSIDQEVPIYGTENIYEVMGYKNLGLIKKDGVFKLIPSEKEDTAIKLLNKSLKKWNGKKAFISNPVLLNRDGFDQYYVLRLYPIEDYQNEFIGICQDVTYEQNREIALRKAIELADQASASKTLFFSNMSHDIRTPMNAILNMSAFALEKSGENKELKEYLNTIHDSAEHLLRLINDILDMNKIEKGQTSVTNEKFDIQNMISEISEMVEVICSKRNQTLIVNTESVKSHFLIGDRLKLSQILINILNNAAKFTPEKGTITFHVKEFASLHKEAQSFEFTIADTGMGIPKSKIPFIFDTFMRGDKDRIGDIEGSGLGLSICKRYVTALGGTISCESQENKGSVFTVLLTMEQANSDPGKINSQKISEQNTNIFLGKRALLCEDNEINQVIAKKIFQKLGFDVDIANDGEEGSTIFINSPDNYYQIIYMDIQMPLLNGYQATEKIRKSNHPQAQTIPIIAMTANVFTDDVQRARSVGMNGHIGKPIVISDIISTTTTVLKKD